MVNVTPKEIIEVIKKSKENDGGFIRREISIAPPVNHTPMSSATLVRSKSLSAENKRPLPKTILESANPETGKLYDLFHVSGYKDGNKVFFDANLNLFGEVSNIDISAYLVDGKDSENYIANKDMSSNGKHYLRMRDCFDCPAVDSVEQEDLMLIVEAKWGKKGFNPVAVSKLIRPANINIISNYTHHHPSKRKGNKPVIIESHNPGKNFPGKVGREAVDGIVIALFREPDNVDDVDYVLMFGKNKDDKPYMGVLGEGDLTLSAGVQITSVEASAFVVPYKENGVPEGGVYPLYTGREDISGEERTPGEPNSYQTSPGDIRTTVTGSNIHYRMDGIWGDADNNKQVYVDDAGYWRKLKYHYSLLLDCEVSGFHLGYEVTSQKNQAANVHNILPLIIMWGCLAEGTLVRMGNGESKPIQDIQIGHKVWNPLTNSECVVENVYRGLEDRDVHIITTENREVRASDGHPFYNRYRGTIVARKLRNGDEILTENGEEKITNIRVVNDRTYVYNLQLAGDGRNDRHFLANGFVSGDFYVQNSCF